MGEDPAHRKIDASAAERHPDNSWALGPRRTTPPERLIDASRRKQLSTSAVLGSRTTPCGRAHPTAPHQKNHLNGAARRQNCWVALRALRIICIQASLFFTKNSDHGTDAHLGQLSSSKRRRQERSLLFKVGICRLTSTSKAGSLSTLVCSRPVSRNGLRFP